MDAALVDRLSRGEGWALLSALPPYDEATSLPLQESLREAGFDAELVAAAMTQSRLRARAVDKFGDFAGGMLFTPDGLEQATRLPIAARHAQRYAAADVSLVHDLGCGLGADAMALSSLEIAVRAVDADPATARVAAVNLRHWPNATVVCSASRDLTTMRSSSGLMETDTVVTYPSGLLDKGHANDGSSRLAAVAGVDRPRRGSWHFRGESANRTESRQALALGQVECQ